MRTTIEIPDDIYKDVKRLAVDENTTVKQIVLRALEGALRTRIPHPAPKRLMLPIIHSKNPGTLDIDNERIYDLIGFP
jgi:hypothetical protein